MPVVVPHTAKRLHTHFPSHYWNVNKGWTSLSCVVVGLTTDTLWFTLVTELRRVGRELGGRQVVQSITVARHGGSTLTIVSGTVLQSNHFLS